MNWREQYRDKIVPVAEAVASIADGEWLVTSHAAANPQVVMRELVAQKERFHNLRIFHVLPVGYTDYLLPENAAHFRHVSTFLGPASREVAARGMADFIPSFFKEVPGLLGESVPVDVAVVNVSPPDAEGYCSLGVSCDYNVRAVEVAGRVIAQVNDCMPRVGGRENAVHISRLDKIVTCADPLPETPPAAAASHVESEIARHCSGLIKDGDTLQLGIGGIPDAVLGFLGDKNDLGIHSEIFSDGAVELIRKGVANGSRKTLHTGKAVATFLVGSRVLYDFVADNPDVVMLPVDYVNDTNVIAQNDNMVSINSCIEVDLTGQVDAESVGPRQFSGVGGQVDFVRGVRASRGGRSIIAMPSTAARGTVSRIVPSLAVGAIVTTSRCDVDYIVTEYGVAHLRGRSLRERAEALIAIAHPDFREELKSGLVK
ncbi:MAG: 4-hydroxybutyrate CoA-transferase [Alistipes sp.]|jgi:4-hydroxybutyrate CoA-transferase|nr:4-hydroxybutyrate CoA-transferase [Alistipes sp.]